MNKYQKRTFLGAFVALVLLLMPITKAEAVNWEDYDTVAGIGMTITIDELKHLEGREVTFILSCPGGLIERTSDVDGGDAELILRNEDVEKAGVCDVRVLDHEGNEVASGSFEIFPDVPVKWELIPLADEPFYVDEEVELKAGYFDKFGNPIRGRLVLVTGDGNIEKIDEDDEGYLHFLFTPEDVGEAKLKLLDTFTDESRTFKFQVIDRNPPPPVVAAPPAQNRSDAVTLLLGQLIRASLLDEYGSAPNVGETSGDGYSLVDSFDVEVGDSESTLHVNEQYDLSITALDRRGKRVQNYVDRVTVETSDPDAIVPTGTIRFKATDRGQKVLSLAVMFQTPGQQTVTIRDEADPEEIFGKASVWVLGHTSAPLNRSITLNEKSGTVRGGRIIVSGTAPAYTNLQLFTVEEGGTRELAMTSSDEEGKFRFDITLEGGKAHALFVRDPEERVKDSETITLTVDALMPLLRSAVLSPSQVTPGAAFTVSAEAESGERAYAALPQGVRVELVRKAQSAEAGFDVYESALTAPAIPGTYAVSISVADSAGNETVETRMLTVATEATGFPVVQNLQAVVQNQDVLLSWSHVSGAAKYRVYFGPTPVNLERFVETQSATTAIRLTGLTGGQATFFAVTALGNNGEESAQKSAVVSAIPRGSLFEFTAIPEINGALFKWVAPQGLEIDRYRIRYGVQPRAPTEERVVADNTLEYRARDLINGVTYFVSLEAVQRNGEIIKDTVEVSVTPGENGMPGIRLSPLDPLPAAGIGGPGGLTAILRDSSHSAAPAHVPESGSSLLLWTMLTVMLGGGWAFRRKFSHL